MDPFCHSHFKLRSSTRLSMYRYSYRMQVEAPALLTFSSRIELQKVCLRRMALALE